MLVAVRPPRIGNDLPALDIAIATACFCGLPSLTNVLMLEDTAFSDLPDFSGIINFRSDKQCFVESP